ncbi:MAG: Flp pilus assembly complex ATPase component TadA [Lachnospiraceae bacterium]|nr:Flp pilus assembly complex ATPase component TadA [Lachnospiraceae bacterium]
MAGFRQRVRIGDVLVQAGLITEEQLTLALEEQKKKPKGTRIGQTIVDMGYISELDMTLELQKHIDVGFIDLRKIEIDEAALHVLTEADCRKYNLIPFAFKDVMTLSVAMVDPQDFDIIDDISIITGLQIDPYIAMASQIDENLDKIYGKQQADAIAEQFLKEQEDALGTGGDSDDDSRKDDVENSPIVILVRNIIEQGVRQRASDIHIEPFETNVKVRYRIDGVLREINTYDKALFQAIIARIKIISGMDISEKRKPQDGRITIDVDYKEYDIRVSNLPTVYGEKVVMRLASKEGFNRAKSELGLRPEDLEKFDGILKNPNGIILVTGPTGSGKSTTLYTALSELSTEEVNVVTVEDPVEANVNGVNQVQVNNKADMTFANALRSILRQDPDIIMIGEIRDSETAEIAVRASITGHLVVSTLHTNSTAATVGRLIDMGIEPYMLGDSLVGIIAQRLVRRLCDCKKGRPATADEKRVLGLPATAEQTVYDPVGCQMCNNLGYKGRIGIYEIMTINQKIRNLIAERATADRIKKAAEEDGMSSLRASAAKYVCEGVTSVAELMKVTYSADES